MVGATGIEPVTPAMSRQCSPAELRAHPRKKYASGRIGQAWVVTAAPAGFNSAMDVPVSAALAPPAPVVVLRPARQTVPLVFASPHSGRDYPAEFLAASRLDPLSLRRSEDSFVDELFAAAPELGAPLIPRPSRAPGRPQPRALGARPGDVRGRAAGLGQHHLARVAAGLGTIARVVAYGEEIYRGKLRSPRPRGGPHLLAALSRRAGGADRRDARRVRPLPADRLPFDAVARHASAAGRDRADFVLGDVHATACAPRGDRRSSGCWRSRAIAVRRNDPYAGGYITHHYGRPREGVHALQIEITRALYMDESRIERLAGFAAVQLGVTRFIAGACRGPDCGA